LLVSSGSIPITVVPTSVVRLAPALGGGVAGYLAAGPRRGGRRVGALAGAVAAPVLLPVGILLLIQARR
jgi:hypothetical protein